MPTYPPLTKRESLASFTRAFRVAGVPVDSALCRAKLPVLYEEELDGWVPYIGMRRFIATLAAREGIGDLGWRAAARAGDRGINSTLRSAIYAAPTLYNALHVTSQLCRSQSTHLSIWIEAYGRDVRVCHANAVGPDIPGYEIQEAYTTALLLRVVRHFLGPRWLPDALLSRGPASDAGTPAGVAPIGVDGVPIRAHARYGGFDVPVDLVWSSNPHPQSAIASVDGASEPPESVAEALRSCLRSYIAGGRPRIELAAEFMGSSVRSLQRALAHEGTSYNRVMELASLDVAKRALADEDASLTEVALRLGYSEQSAFSRAFHGWTGLSPRRYRRHLCEAS